MFNDLSLRYKIPLRTALLVILVAIVVSVSILLRAQEVFKEDLKINSASMGQILSHSLTESILHDDVWKSYEIINMPFRHSQEGALQAETTIILDAEGMIYVSTEPARYPMLTALSAAGRELGELSSTLDQRNLLEQQIIEGRTLYVVTPIESDGVLLGNLLMAYSDKNYSERFMAFTMLAAITTILIVILLLPVAVYWGRRYADPLVDLADCMSLIGADNSSIQECSIPEVRSHDELGQLHRQFQQMVSELQEKADLERQMIAAERLAAIGRFTAGIAHEINNPLGGMLNATNTLRRHGKLDPMTEKTIDLLDRGLHQIRETVSALLVEAKTENHPLSRQDVEDTRTLVTSEAAARSAQINWRNEMDSEVDLPSTLMRQVLLNLLLNAIQASGEQGWVECRVQVAFNALWIAIRNSGEEMSDETISHLFEPFVTGRERGRGLGLWVTYQIVTGLNGTIEINSGVADTLFTVNIPLPVQEAA